MPELPEVEVIRRTLSKHLCGKTISAVSVLEPFILTQKAKSKWPDLVGSNVNNVKRLGKCLIVELDGQKAMLIHLRMTGRLLWSVGSPTIDAYTHVVWQFSGSDHVEGALVFRDVRKFGRIDLVELDKLGESTILRNFGPDALSLSQDEFVSRISDKKAGIKAVLLNQGNMAGLGNIYVDEVLFDARIHPRTEAARLKQEDWSRLYDSTQKILEDAIRLGGSSMRDYVHTDGVPGSFQDFHRVYQKAGRPCERCESIIKSGKIAGRTSSYCPRCQKELKAA